MTLGREDIWIGQAQAAANAVLGAPSMRLPITQLQPPPCRQSAAPARSLVPALILSAAPTPSIELVRLSTPAACTTTPPGLTRRSGVAQRQDARLSQSNLLLPPLTTPPRGPTSSRVHTPVWRALQTLLFCRPISSADRPVLISPRPWPRPWHFLPIPGPQDHRRPAQIQMTLLLPIAGLALLCPSTRVGSMPRAVSLSTPVS